MDIVLFVNGIPFCVMECKAPQIEVEQAVYQSVRNQNDDYVPKLFIYNQMVLGINKNSAMYATTGTAAKFWGVWKEPHLDSGEREFIKLQELVNKPLDKEVVRKIANTFGVDPASLEAHRLVTDKIKPSMRYAARKDCWSWLGNSPSLKAGFARLPVTSNTLSLNQL